MVVGSDTRAIITGASKGIGRATAAAFAKRGARVGLLARDQAELDALAGELGGGAEALVADVTKREEVVGGIDGFVERAGGLEVLVANAGLARYMPFADQDIADIEQMVNVNVLGTLYTVKAALPHMLGAARGHIVITSSGAGLRAFPSAAVYGATKAADRGFAEALRHELSGTGVSVTTVFPGEIATELHTGREEKLPDWRDSAGALPVEPLAEAIVDGVEQDRRAVYMPREIRLLGLNGVAPSLTDRMVAALRGATAAPRRD